MTRRLNKLVAMLAMQVAELIQEVKRVHQRLGTLMDFNYKMSGEDIWLSWRTMDYPTVRAYSVHQVDVFTSKYYIRGRTDLSQSRFFSSFSSEKSTYLLALMPRKALEFLALNCTSL